MPHCPQHPTITLRCPACDGARGKGKGSQQLRAETARKNGKRGGRPRKQTEE